jgi:diguanylate cyclase (GGDEF)-like protein/PAS domain S-box-containing protein
MTNAAHRPDRAYEGQTEDQPPSATASPTDGGQRDATIYRQTFDNLPMSMALLDHNGVIIDVNERWRAFARANGGDPAGYIGRSYGAACQLADEPQEDTVESLFDELLAGRRERIEFEYPCHSPDERRWFLMQAYRFRDAGQLRVAVLHIDITQRRLAEEAAHQRAATDSLTGLLNRETFNERADQILAIAHREGLHSAILFLDLDDYKGINDVYGHEVGDRVLGIVAERLREQTRDSDLLARYGGDELVVIAEGADRASAQCLSDRLQRIITAPVTVDNTTFHVACSQGIALYPEHGHSLQELVSAADAAMYQAKQEGGAGAMFATAASSVD